MSICSAHCVDSLKEFPIGQSGKLDRLATQVARPVLHKPGFFAIGHHLRWQVQTHCHPQEDPEKATRLFVAWQVLQADSHGLEFLALLCFRSYRL